MRSDAVPLDDGDMTTGPVATASLRLDIELGSNPLRGSLTGPNGPTIAFAGWIELASVIEQLHHTYDQALSQPDESPLGPSLHG